MLHEYLDNSATHLHALFCVKHDLCLWWGGMNLKSKEIAHWPLRRRRAAAARKCSMDQRSLKGRDGGTQRWSARGEGKDREREERRGKALPPTV